MNEVRSVTPLPTEVTSGCGASVVQMALEFYGIHIPQRDIAIEMGTTTENGTSIEQMREFLWKLGFITVEKANCSWDELKRIKNLTAAPMIVEWWDDRNYPEMGIETPNLEPDSHYSIVQRVNDEYIVIADPSLGDEVNFDRWYWMNHWRYRNDYVGAYGWFMLVGR